MPARHTDEFAAHRKREASLMKELRRAPISTVAGVVHPIGAGASRSQGDKQWTLTIQLIAWRAPNSPLQHRPLLVRKKLSERAAMAAQSRLQPYDIVRMRVRLAMENPFGSPQALLEGSVHRPHKDEELAAVARKLRRPVTLRDAKFGILKLDRSIGWFRGKVTWRGTPAQLYLVHDVDGSIDETLSNATVLFRSAAAWHRRVVDHAVAELLELKNTYWLEEEESRVTAQQLKRKMKLESIHVEPDGKLEFWFDDGDLFGGHSIVVAGNLDKGPVQVDLMG